MSKILTLVSVAALLFSPVAFSFDPTADANEGSFQVLGEKLDSGLGDLSPEYSAAEYQTYRVAGETIDSGLGELSPSYTAAEFQKSAQVVATR